MIEDTAVRKLKTIRLDYEDRHYVAPKYRCERCGFTTRQVTSGLAHAKAVHNDPPPKDE